MPRVCEKKPLSKRDAEIALKRAAKPKARYRKEKRMYFCHEHNAWHLTHREKNQEVHEVVITDPEIKAKFEQLIKNQ